MHYNIVHKTDLAYQPWHASTSDYAERLLAEITKTHPELIDKLHIIENEPAASDSRAHHSGRGQSEA